MIQLRPYQTEAIDAFIAGLGEGVVRSLVVLPTGCGKTITALALATEWTHRTLWIAHREELITQPLKALRSLWPSINAGVVKAGRNEWARDFVFASIQTIHRQRRLEKLRDFDLVVIDEAHHAAAKSYKTVLEHLGCLSVGGPALLGLTATPERRDVLALDDVFQRIVYSYPLRKAVEDGFLVSPRMIPYRIKVDLDKVGSRGGDFRDGELDTALLEAGIVGEVCRAVDALARDRKTIIFTVSVRQAQLISEQLQRTGYRSSYISGSTPLELRRQRLQWLASGKITHMVNCMVLTEGFDDPSVNCIVMARPTQSKSLYIQCIGRGLRIAPNKSDCLIVDMVGMTDRHTLIQAPVIFGVKAKGYATQKTVTDPDEITRRSVKESLLLSQVIGVESVTRSHLQWVPTAKGGLALNCGQGGNVLLRPEGHDWNVEVIGRADAAARETLTMHPVDMELAQGIAEDYAQRSEAVYLTKRSARWRRSPATDAQLKALERWKIPFHSNITKGEASDLITQRTANDWRNDPATHKQIWALRQHGVPFDETTLTKGAAGKLLAQVRACKNG